MEENTSLSEPIGTIDPRQEHLSEYINGLEEKIEELEDSCFTIGEIRLAMEKIVGPGNAHGQLGDDLVVALFRGKKNA